MSNINIEIPDDLHKKLKLEAVKEEISLKNLIIDSLQNNLGKKK
jgi:predicted HicB family RNase H-like nuclease